MNDMSSVIVPKSDQVNAEDFIAGPRTFTIEGVSISPGTEQPVSIKLRGERRVFRPCKSMSRVLVAAWGPDANEYTGRSLTLYRDPKVKWGGLAVGGIRISHMTDIDPQKVDGAGVMTMALTETKGKRAPYIVKALKSDDRRQPDEQTARPRQTPEQWATDHIAFVVGAASLERLAAVQESGKKAMAKLIDSDPELHLKVSNAYLQRANELAEDDPFEPEGRTDAQHGDQFDGSEGGE